MSYQSLARQLKSFQDSLDQIQDQLEKLELRVLQIEDYLETQSEEDNAGDLDKMVISDDPSEDREFTERKGS